VGMIPLLERHVGQRNVCRGPDAMIQDQYLDRLMLRIYLSEEFQDFGLGSQIGLYGKDGALMIFKEWI